MSEEEARKENPMSNLKWADVAHYYQFSGICLRINGVEHPKEFLGVKIVGGLPFFRVKVGEIGAVSHTIDECTPILRHLEDMTIEQCKELYTLKTGLDPKYMNRILKKSSTDILSKEWFKRHPKASIIILDISNKPTAIGGEYTPKEFQKLIEWGFCLWDELFESGQSIRKGVEA